MRRQIVQLGFTLVEMIVALAVFSIVVTIAVGALLSLIATNEQLQSERTVMTNLSFALDSMAREIRTGTGYYCEGRPNYNAGGPNNIFDASNSHESILGTDTNDCENGKGGGDRLQGVSIIESGDSISSTTANRILYFFDDTGGPDSGKLMRRVGDEPAQSIVSSGIFITDAEFFVSGSDPLSSGTSQIDQPTVTIYIEARKADDLTAKSYHLQTTVVQRTLDI